MLRVDTCGRGYTIAQQWESTNGRPSGFDYIRICLAVAVLLWHSYQVSYGNDAALAVWDGPIGILLQLILPMFFALSGFLVCGSLQRTRSLPEFLALRAIRICPALWIEVILSALVLGPIVTTLTLSGYFASRDFYFYLTNTIGWVHFFLPGVFLENPNPRIVNTSLWTVPYELECYVALSIMFLVGFMRSNANAIIQFAVCTSTIVLLISFGGEISRPPGIINGRVLMLCFVAGAVIFRTKKTIPYHPVLALVALVATAALLRNEQTVFIAPLCAAYATVYLGLMNPPRTLVIETGDYSYGVYLYAGPIQQTVVLTLGSWNNWFTNVLITLPVSVLFALFSWHCIEKPFTHIRHAVVGWIRYYLPIGWQRSLT